VPLFAAKREYYSVRKGTHTLGTFNVIVPVQQLVTVSIVSVLLVADIVPQPIKTKILNGFSGYDPVNNPDPVQYATANLGPDVTPDMFLVRSSFTLTKKGQQTFDTKQRDALLALYNGTAPGGIFVVPNEDNLSSYLKNSGINAVKIREEAVGRIPAPQQDGLHERGVSSINATQEIDKIIDDVVKTEAQGLDCSGIVIREESRIATLLFWPEFKIDWVDVAIQVGCIRVVITIPVPRARISKKVLYAYVGHPTNLGQTVVDDLKVCIIKAAVAGAVIGIVLADFPAGLAAFVAVFNDCVAYAAGQLAACLIPGLEMLTESTAWT
jgi:hypothetical protein